MADSTGPEFSDFYHVRVKHEYCSHTFAESCVAQNSSSAASILLNYSLMGAVMGVCSGWFVGATTGFLGTSRVGSNLQYVNCLGVAARFAGRSACRVVISDNWLEGADCAYRQ